MSDDHCKDCQTPSACGHYAECLRTIIRRPAGDAAPLPVPEGMTLAQRSAVALQCLPAAPYRDMLERLHADMLGAAQLPASDEVLEALEKAVGALDAGVKISAESVLHDMLRAALRSLRGNKT